MSACLLSDARRAEAEIARPSTRPSAIDRTIESRAASGRLRDGDAMALSPAKARKLVEALHKASGDDDARVASEEVLNFLLGQLEELRDLANGYPRNPISGAVWSDGADLARLCDDLTSRFSGMKRPREEELASRLATGMACQVMGHYPEEIFPRVLRHSKCREAVSDLENAIGGYEAIVADYDEMDLDYLLEDDCPLDESGRAILEAVHQAASRLRELRPEKAVDLEGLMLNLERRLAPGDGA